MTWSLKTSVPYSSSTRLILRSLSQRSSIHSTQGKERMFRVYFDLAKCFETIDGNRGGVIEMGAPREKRVSPQCDNNAGRIRSLRGKLSLYSECIII